ncbi:MAG: hypothetical protein D6722_14850 [Bacteroidetes bacterium]|nr:MAG: hypothetical protein D6722_14850 [Bacteroidota bacterium]
MARYLLLGSLLGLFPLWLSAQRPFYEDFTLQGDTYLTELDCFRLTEAEIYASGSIWYKRPLSLLEPFAIELSILAGCEDALGADGMVFVFTPQTNQLGFVGEGIGFAGLRPSVGIEIDTWENEHLNDPSKDHLAIMRNGWVGHQRDLAGPVVIPNIEDCSLHSLIILWEPGPKRLAVLIDGVERIATQHDLVGDIFGGRTEVYWGVTAATGRYHNIHEVCFDRLGARPLPMSPPDRAE